MNNDDKFSNPNDQGIEDDSRYDDGLGTNVREEEYAAGQEEWQEQPVDDLVEETVDEFGAPKEKKRDPFEQEAFQEGDSLEDGPLEDDYVQHADEGQDDGNLNEDGLSEDGQKQKPAKTGVNPLANIAKYVPYVGAGIAALALAFFGVQQFSGAPSQAPQEQPVAASQDGWNNPSQENVQQAANELPAPPSGNEPIPMPADSQGMQPLQPINGNMITPAENVQPIAAPVVSQLESRIAELTSQIESMKQTQDDLNRKLQEATATPPAMDENSKAASQALIDRIAQLEQRLAESASPEKKNDDASKPVKTDSEKADKKSAKSSKSSSTDFMEVKSKRTAKKRSSRRASVDPDIYRPRGSGDGWVLRSAQPGAAWLSPSINSSNLRRIVPGDKVPGLGTIIAVRQTAGRWVVEGTQGMVR